MSLQCREQAKNTMSTRRSVQHYGHSLRRLVPTDGFDSLAEEVRATNLIP